MNPMVYFFWHISHILLIKIVVNFFLKVCNTTNRYGTLSENDVVAWAELYPGILGKLPELRFVG
jgi:hypothetical protein